jgi:hypothetical protein
LDDGKICLKAKYACHVRFTENFFESQPGSEESFTVTGGFLHAATTVVSEDGFSKDLKN